MIKNKKGILPLFMLVVVTIIAVLLIGLFLFTAKYRWIFIGIAILVAVIYLIGKAFQSSGEFSRNKLAIILILSGIGLFFIFGSGYIQQTGFASEVVYVPQYGSMKCDLARSDFVLYSANKLTTQKSITCGVNMNGYTDSCNFQIQVPSSSITNVGAGYQIQKCNNAGDCIDTSGNLNTNTWTSVYNINIDINRDGYIDSSDGDPYSTIKITPKAGWFGLGGIKPYDIQVLGNAYYLEDIQGNGYGTTYSEGCNLLQIDYNAHITKKEFTKFNYQQTQNQVPFGKRIFYVWGMTPAVTSNVITKYNKKIYIEKSGYYNNILIAQDGYKYVDWQNPIPDNSIECVPSNLYVCNADATLRKTPGQDVTGQDCSLIRGVPPTDFLKISTDQCCKFKCVNNKLQFYGCEKCAVCSQGYSYDLANNRCVKVGDTGTGPHDSECSWYQDKSPQTEDCGLFGYRKLLGNCIVIAPTCKTAGWVYAIIAGGVIIIIVLILILLTPKSRKKK